MAVLVRWCAVVMIAVVQVVAAAADVRPTVAVVELEGTLAERAKFMSPFGKGETTLRDATTAIAGLAARKDVQGVLIRLRDAKLGVTQVEELGHAIAAVRASGKKVHLYSYGFDTPELLLGSFCDEIIAQAGGGVSLPGLATSEMYLADTLAWVGIKADMVQVGDYKGAAEQMVNSKPSEAWTQNIEQLLDGMYANIRGQLKKGRKLDDKSLDGAMNELWMALAEDAKKLGLVDSTVDLPAISEHLSKAYGGEISWEGNVLDAKSEEELDVTNPFAALRALTEKKEYAPKRPTIAVLHIDGAIVDGDSTGPGLMGGESSVGSLTIRRALTAIEKSDLIKGVVVRIDSPGGSAIASEVIWQGIRRVAAKKPVWVSVGGMAASGGYYIAVAGDQIYVNPGSIVGSIGVVGGKLSLDGVMQWARVNVVERTRGPRAAMGSMSPWNDEQRGYIRRKMTETYDLFAKRVKAGRKDVDMTKVAEGRLFTGRKAQALGMADKVGGLDECITDLAARVDLTPGGYDVMSYPAPMTLMEMIEQMMGQTGVGASIAGAPGTPRQSLLLGEADVLGREMLGETAWRDVRASMVGLLELRKEPVLLMSPRVVVIR